MKKQKRNKDGVEETDTFDEAPNLPQKRRGVDRGDGRDDYGHFVGSENRPWVDKEQLGLDQVADREGVDIIRTQVRATIDGHRRDGTDADQGRFYDGLFKNADGTYTGIEVKSGDATRDPGQRSFDGTVSRERPATATLPPPDSKTIEIVEVILESVR
ncbi:hypothetical protein [Microbacterium sp. SD291]|uniref:hypothetical protein n=1 Tax=Microbacterium sp. SD291 TaxID=2782007 RepID=UPI001A96AD6E|nr:hypothetical protein [Microbacterium sp. SD291]MBO0981415.1 hypothetical protein [Microbacterium sp. SD291]